MLPKYSLRFLFLRMHPYLSALEKQFRKNANKTKAAGAKAYLLHQFEFYGLQAPERRKICKLYLQDNPVPTMQEVEKIVKEAWQLAEREWQYFAIELLAYYKKQWKPPVIKLMEYCITHKSWWDTVDYIADAWAGEYFKLFHGKTISVTAKWNNAENMWLQRTSLLFQKKYKKDTDTKLLAQYILHLADSKEFFIRKAIGWTLREYAKTNDGWVKKFVAANTLSPLSKKEALKHFQ